MSANGDIKVTRRKLSDYTPDPRNANKGSERGWRMVNDSIQEDGMGRSLVAAADRTLIAGNKTAENAADLGIEEVIEVTTNGKQVVVVRREDWQDGDDEHARRYAYRDNRAGELSLEWDAEQVLRDLGSGMELDDIFHDWEIEQLLIADEGVESWEDHWRGMPEFEEEDLTADSKLIVSFATPEDREAFSQLVGQPLTDKTRSIWYPRLENRPFMDKRYDEES